VKAITVIVNFAVLGQGVLLVLPTVLRSAPYILLSLPRGRMLRLLLGRMTVIQFPARSPKFLKAKKPNSLIVAIFHNHIRGSSYS
jgi:hypothetical protein